MLKKILEFMDNINEWAGRIFSWIIVILTVLVVLEVIMRRIFNSPTTWNFEVSIQLYGFHFMMVAGYTLLHKAHVAVDVVHAKFGKRTKAVLDVITYIVFFFPFLAVLLHEGILYAANAWSIQEKSWSAFAPALYPIKTVIPIMAFLVLIQGISIFIRQLHLAIRGKEL